MLDVKDSINRLTWTVDHHYLHIKNQHEFMRAWAIQFEMAYTDFRTIQMALQLDGEQNHPLLADFTATYDLIRDYEYEFAAGGLDGFNAKYSDQLNKYNDAVQKFDELIAKVAALQ